jgi:hypothetical protein
MPTPLIISEADIAPLLNDPAMMDGAIDACRKRPLRSTRAVCVRLT